MARPMDDRHKIAAMARAGVPYVDIARQFHTTTNAISGIVWRVQNPDADRRDRGPEDGGKRAPPSFHNYRNLAPSKTPFASDFTCPDFAWDEDHLAAVHGARPTGYPVAEFKRRVAG